MVVDCLLASFEVELLVPDAGALFTASDVLLRACPFWPPYWLPSVLLPADLLPAAAGLLLSLPVASAGRPELPVADEPLLSLPDASAGRPDLSDADWRAELLRVPWVLA